MSDDWQHRQTDLLPHSSHQTRPSLQADLSSEPTTGVACYTIPAILRPSLTALWLGWLGQGSLSQISNILQIIDRFPSSLFSTN